MSKSPEHFILRIKSGSNRSVNVRKFLWNPGNLILFKELTLTSSTTLITCFMKYCGKSYFFEKMSMSFIKDNSNEP